MAFTEKYLLVKPPISLAGREIKRYHVNGTDTAIEPDIEAAAEEFLPKLLPDADETPPATFIVLHRGREAAYLNAYSWVWDNVLHCACAVAGIPFLGCPDTDPTNFTELTRPWIGCVWELPALGHERSAWVKYLLAPDEPDLAGYLADTLPPGPTGGPS